MVRVCSFVVLCIAAILLASNGKAEEPTGKREFQAVEWAYPGLVTGAPRLAKLCKLPEGVLLRAEGVEIAASDLDKNMEQAPEYLHQQLKKNRLFLLEQMATERLLTALVCKEAKKAGVRVEEKDERELIQEYFERLTEDVEVRDEEVAQFYEKNKHLFGGATVEQVKERIRQFLLSEKKLRVIAEHVQTLGQRVPITVSASWVMEQAVLAQDNPLDNARESGKPSLVAFSASGCCSPDRILSILRSIHVKYGDKLNTLHIDAREKEILAARYSIRSIPTWLFYDRDGKEVHRHIGDLALQEIEPLLTDMGVE